uniref:Uncharacterized protein LOC114343471 n=1 Tax=Diabrotica virgifera virgifera TaxID=50390 RepID=A0A6P7GXG0_DIAVI
MLNCFVIPEITGFIPAVKIDISDLGIPSHLQLADDYFYKPQRVELLIGSDLFWKILGTNRISLGKNKPFMQETSFGWIIAGPYSTRNNSMRNRTIKCNFANTMEVTEQLSKFWELEEVFSEKPALSSEEVACEKHFENTVRRDVARKFIVFLPFKEPISSLGDSFRQAKYRFLNLERKLSKDADLRTLYSTLIEEYK